MHLIHLFSFKIKARIADIFFEIKKLFFNKIKSKFLFYVKLESPKDSQHGKSWLVHKCQDGHT